MKTVMKRLLALWVIGIVSGCSEPNSGSDWYEESRAHTEDRDAYIRDQVTLGVGEREARQNADLNYYIENTVRPKDLEPPPRDTPR